MFPVRNAVLTPAVIAAAAEPELAWVQKELGNWPVDSCWDTCSSIVGCLHRNLPVWKFSLVHGYFAIDASNERYAAHCWLTARLRGRPHLADPLIVVDPTAGQFLRGKAIRVFSSMDAHYARYLPGRLPRSR